MRKTRLALTKTRVNGRRYYCVTTPKLGGRNRRFFKEKAEAETFMQLAKVQQENYGTAALSIPDALRVEAIECSELLEPFGKTLRDAANFYAAHLKAITGSRNVSSRWEVAAKGVWRSPASRDAFFFGPGEAHQLSNNGTEDFAYYVIADNPRHDSCYYPDSGKWAVSKESADYIIVQGTETDYYKDEE
jgi:hypothetical protein